MKKRFLPIIAAAGIAACSLGMVSAEVVQTAQVKQEQELSAQKKQQGIATATTQKTTTKKKKRMKKWPGQYVRAVFLFFSVFFIFLLYSRQAEAL